jgi:hypothetical protein
MLSEGLINGRSVYKETISTTITRGIDPSLYDAVEINSVAGTVGLAFVTPSMPIQPGKEITVFSVNNARSVYLVNIVRARATVDVAGGNVCTLYYAEDPNSPGSYFWVIKSMFNNDY